MRLFEVIYSEVVEAEDFFDAVEKAKKIGREIISISEAPIDDDEDVFDWTNKRITKKWWIHASGGRKVLFSIIRRKRVNN